MIAESGIEEAITEFIRLSRALRPSEDTTLSAAVSLAAIIKFSISISDAARVRLLAAHLKRREFIGGLTVTLLAASDRALSQTPPNLPRVGVLVSASPEHHMDWMGYCLGDCSGAAILAFENFEVTS